MRLVDLLYEASFLPPWAFVAPRFQAAKGKTGPTGDVAAAVALFEKLRNRIRQSPIYAVDLSAGFFLTHRGGDPFLPSGYLPACRTPAPRCFLETRRPDRPAEELGPGRIPGKGLPACWGFYAELVPPAAWEKVCDLNDCVPHPHTDEVTVYYLFVSPDERCVTGPLATYYVARDRNGTLLDDQVLTTPNLVILDGEVEDLATMEQFFLELLWPVLFSQSVLSTAGAEILVREAPDAVQAKREKSGRRPLFATRVLDLAPVLDELRYRGQAGLLGIGAALRSCAAHMLPRDAPPTEPMLVWVPGKD